MTDITKQLAEALRWILAVPDCTITSPQREKASQALAAYAAVQSAEFGFAPLTEISACPHCGGPIDQQFAPSEPAQGERGAALTPELLRSLKHAADWSGHWAVNNAYHILYALAQQPAARVALTDEQVREGLRLHHLEPTKPSQLADGFRAGVRWAERAHGFTAPAAQEKQG